MVEIKYFFQFIIKPTLSEEYKLDSIVSHMKIIWSSLLIVIIVAFIHSLLIKTPFKLLGVFPLEKMREINTLSILRISLLTPLIEESLFRLPLRFSKLNSAILIGLIFYLFFDGISITLAYILAFTIFLTIIYFLDSGLKIYSVLNSLFDKYFYLFFNFQALAFGFLHLTNFNLNNKFLPLYPLFILNYIFLGYFFGYLRVTYKNGFMICLLTHVSMNSLYCLLIKI
jgi:hypothetical protein